MADKNAKAYVYINGKVVGTVENPLALVNEIRSARRKGLLSGEVNVSYSERLNSVNINADRGRIRKPYIIIENKQSKLTNELIEKLKSREINFNYLLRNGIVEYLDAEEEENMLVALSEDGIIEPEMEVSEGDALIGKVAPPRFLEENLGAGGLEEKMRDDTAVLKTGEKGVVDSVIFTESTGATKIVKVRIRSLRTPENGDKFASRHGQKGVVALIVPPEDMPFTAEGIVPDLLLNPHSIPTRLTFGHLLETLGGKAGAVSGTIVDGTAFGEAGSDRIENYGKTLEAHGFERYGNEVLYDGMTGMPFKSTIFNGVVYYNRLYHMVSNKIQVRSRGKVQILTHQPTEGKARQGALRFGEMERDALIGYGASLLLKERLLDQSDKAVVLVCKDCGSLGYYDHIKKTMVCPLSKGSDFVEVEISYAFKVLLDEIKSLHIMTSIKLNE